HLLAFHKNHRIVIAYGAFQQTFCIGRITWHYHFQTWTVCIPAFKSLAVRSGKLPGGSRWPAEYDRNIKLPAAHLAHFGGVVYNLVNSNKRKIERHKLNDRSVAIHRRTHTDTGKTHFGNWGIDHAFGAKLIKHSLTGFVGAVVFGNFLAH